MPDMWNAYEFRRQARTENDSGVCVNQIDILFSDELDQSPHRNRKSVKHQDEPGCVPRDDGKRWIDKNFDSEIFNGPSQRPVFGEDDRRLETVAIRSL